jgi:DNA replication initiation complex subunit (GINS family)
MTTTTFIKVAAASAAVGLLLTACAGSSPDATTVTVTATATETKTEQARPAPEEDTDNLSESEKDEQYVLLVSTRINTYGIQDSTLSELGRTVCAALDKGIDVEDIVMLAKSNGLSTDEAAAIIAAAIVVYCPWNESAV